MAKKKTSKENSVIISFKGGPRDGLTMNVVNPPPSRLRLAFPEWCNYYRVGNTSDYEYDNDRDWESNNFLEMLKTRKSQ